jgi:hypothetical protein
MQFLLSEKEFAQFQRTMILMEKDRDKLKKLALIEKAVAWRNAVSEANYNHTATGKKITRITQYQMNKAQGFLDCLFGAPCSWINAKGEKGDELNELYPKIIAELLA